MNFRLITIAVCLALFASVGAAQEDPGWPRVKTGPNGKLTMYMPQADSWDYKLFKARMAVVAEPTGGEPVPGAIEFQADTIVDNQTRTVGLTNLKVTEARFPGADETLAPKVTEVLNQHVAGKSLSLSLDRLLAMIGKEEFSGREVAVKNDPPKIFVSTTPAVLVLVDGDPVMQRVPNTGLLYAVNTNWDMILDTTASQVYLLDKDFWLTTTDPKKPDWQPVSGSLPAEFNAIPDDNNWREVRKHIPAQATTETAPKVYLSGVPAELILFEGEPQMTPIPGTKLMFMANTESDLLFNTPDSTYYYLVAGRWFKATSLEGPWAYAGGALPEDFKKIPPDHQMGRLLASVPGTDEAQDAVMLATVPTFGTANREMTTLTVTYDGSPLFKPIDGSPVKYATNTLFNVLQVASNYYCCYEAVWFVSNDPNGPWTVCDSIPKEIYEIPATSPMYPVTYVQVYESTPQAVTYGYTSGYENSYIADGSVVYGTGYNYQPYLANAVVWGLGLAATYAINSQIIDNWSNFWGRYPPYSPVWRPPYYAPYGHSYGAGAYYNPWNGTWGRGAYAYGPYGGVAGRAAYNPYTGTYARGYAAHGPYSSGFGMQAYNPRTGTYAATRQGSNPYSSWGTSVVRNGDDWLQTGHYNDTRAFRTSEGAKGIAGDDRGYAKDSNGNRYIKGDDGWSQWDGNQWKPSAQPRGGDVRSREQVNNNRNMTEGRVPGGAKNNMFVGDDGGIYRQNGNNWQKYDNKGKWENAAKVDTGRPEASDRMANRTGNTASQLDRTNATDRAANRGTGNAASSLDRTMASDRAAQTRDRAAQSGAATRPSTTDRATRPSTADRSTRPSTANSSTRPSGSSVSGSLNRDAQARSRGNQSTSRYQSMPSKTAAPRTQSVQRSSSSSRPSYSGGARSSGGARPSGGRSGGRSGGGRR